MGIATVHNSSSILTLALTKEPGNEHRLLTCLEDAVQEFRVLVWERGMQSQVESSSKRALAYRLGSFHILTYTLAGRVMTTLQDSFKGEVCTVTVLAAEGEIPSRMGLHGIDGTFDQALCLLRQAIEEWEKKPFHMSPDSSVQLEALARAGSEN